MRLLIQLRGRQWGRKKPPVQPKDYTQEVIYAGLSWEMEHLLSQRGIRFEDTDGQRHMRVSFPHDTAWYPSVESYPEPGVMITTGWLIKLPDGLVLEQEDYTAGPMLRYINPERAEDKIIEHLRHVYGV